MHIYYGLLISVHRICIIMLIRHLMYFVYFSICEHELGFTTDTLFCLQTSMQNIFQRMVESLVPQYDTASVVVAKRIMI